MAKLELQRTSPPTKKAHTNRSGCGWSSQSAIGGAIDRAGRPRATPSCTHTRLARGLFLVGDEASRRKEAEGESCV